MQLFDHFLIVNRASFINREINEVKPRNDDLLWKTGNPFFYQMMMVMGETIKQKVAPEGH